METDVKKEMSSLHKIRRCNVSRCVLRYASKRSHHQMMLHSTVLSIQRKSRQRAVAFSHCAVQPMAFGDDRAHSADIQEQIKIL